METISNVRVGHADVKPWTSAHTRGVHAGNKRGLFAREPGVKNVGRMAVATPRRSTGVNARARRPIDPRMPVLTPA